MSSGAYVQVCLLACVCVFVLQMCVMFKLHTPLVSNNGCNHYEDLLANYKVTVSCGNMFGVLI